MEDCAVCCSAFNKTTRKAVWCFKCQYKACTSCWKRYILDSVNDAQCMNCHTQWTPEFMDETFSKYWRTRDYRERRMQVLMDRERALMPATIPAVEEEKRKRQLQNELVDVRRRMQELEIEESRILRELSRPSNKNTEKPEAAKILCKCPAADCKGFVLCSPEKHACAVCDTEVCKECFAMLSCNDDEEDGTEHVCRDEDLATAKLLKKECKPCPGCAVLIHRWTGCPMMFCTHCNTAFDWNTLERIKHGRIHNPHYTEYLARRGQHQIQGNGTAAGGAAVGVANCNALPTPYDLSMHLTKGVRNTQTGEFYPYYTLIEHEAILNQQRVISHIEEIEMPAFNPHTRISPSNEDLRVQLILKDIPEEEFAKRVLEREEKREKMRATYEILDMYVRAGTDLIRRIMGTPAKNKEEIMRISKEVTELNDYVMDCFAKQTKRFGSLRKPKLARLFGLE